MALYYDFYETPVPKGSDRKKTYHVRLVPSGVSSTDEIIEEISSATTYTEADMKGAVQALTDYIRKELEDGKVFHFEGLGYFQLTLTGPLLSQPDEKRSESFRVRSVAFRPEKKLLKELKGLKPRKQPVKNHSGKLNERETDQLLRKYFANNNYLTASQFRAILGLTKSTAFRRLRQWCEKGKLKKIYHHGNPYYVLLPENLLP
ncbi:MAG: HU family DNA-binding protein [Tannerellaceae bacterium]|jgi:predicted histone-like DNA-binding protein|nr:HU family DNA-binding protein [Tannerellaceae bacterium]